MDGAGHPSLVGSVRVAVAARVRFAPSPTGRLHLGGALTALMNRLFAGRHQGSLLLRIDDTDQARTVPGAEESILEDLGWLGIGWDEGPVRQSDRAERYAEAASRAEGAFFRDGAVRLTAHGAPEFVILRSDGSATYHWATAVDDLDFEITDVIRGNDHLSNTPLHAAAIRALGGEPPRYLHHALILDPEEGKLSKRDQASTIAGLRNAGYPPEAVANLLGLLGSSGPGDVLSMDELAERFDEDRLARGTVTLDPSRLRSLSIAWLRRLPAPDLVARVLPFAPADTLPEQVVALEPALRGVRTLAEAGELVAAVVRTPARHSLPSLAAVRGRYPDRLDEQQARELVDELRRAGVPLREARIALTGLERGPELWAVLAALPRDEAIRRAA
jgi:glutamyl/glutaminyl-tRNA synthetase